MIAGQSKASDVQDWRLCDGAPPNGKRPVVSVLEAQEVVVTAAHVRQL